MIRPATLPMGWYPHEAQKMRGSLQEWTGHARGRTPEAYETREGVTAQVRACVAPHAGWSFCGALAAASVASLTERPGTVVIAGGHLRPEDPFLVSTADAQETPLGTVDVDTELTGMLRDRFNAEETPGIDNSTDALIPIPQYLFPEVRDVVCIVPPRTEAFDFGVAVSRYARETERRLAVIGSTDLTHYGPNFGFTTHGIGGDAHQWVVESNDARFLDALTTMKPEQALSRALQEHSACSPGGAVAAMAFAQDQGAEQGEVLDHYTSYDIHPGSSFVGYGGVVFT